MKQTSKNLLRQENARRRKAGLEPLTSLKFQKLDKDSVRSSSNFPCYTRNPRGVSVAHIPSATFTGTNDTGRDSIMERVTRGEITGKEAQEIIRKSQCLAPAFNKGAVQYIGSSDAARDAGKKV